MCVQGAPSDDLLQDLSSEQAAAVMLRWVTNKRIKVSAITLEFNRLTLASTGC